MKKILFIVPVILTLLMISCATDPYEKNRAVKLEWEKHAKCKTDSTLYDSTNTHNIYLCSVQYTSSMPKLFPNWQAGKTYMGAYSSDRKFSLDPIYEHIYSDTNYKDKNTDNYVLYKKYGDKKYTRTGYKTDGSTFEHVPTPIEYLAIGYIMNSTPCSNPETQPHLCEYSGAFGNNKSTFFLLDSLKDFSKKIDNIDTSSEREDRFPSVQKLVATNHIYTNKDTVLVRHNVNGKVFYQGYQSDGVKLGPEIPYEKVVYFHMRTSTYELNKNAPYQARPWIHRGDDFYLPVIHFPNNTFFDPTKKDYGNFLGATLIDIEVHPSKAYTGARVAKYPKFKAPGGFAFKDDKGVYFSYVYYDVFMNRYNPDLIVAKIKGDPNNFYRDMFDLPFYTGKLNNDGTAAQQGIRSFENMDSTYSVNKVSWRDKNLSEFHAENKFKTIEEIQSVLVKKQEQIIKGLQLAEKKRKEEEAYEAESKRIKDAVAKNMAGRWAEQDQKEKEHQEKMKILDRNEKNKKPHPLLTIDLKKIYDSEGAERRAKCFKKMSDSKKAYVSGKQNWHFQGKCK